MQEALAGATKVAVETFQAMATVRSFAHEAGVAERYHQRLRQVYRLEGKEAATYAITLWASGVWGQGTLGMGVAWGLGDMMAWGAMGHGDNVAWGQGTWGCGGTGLGDVMAWG